MLRAKQVKQLRKALQEIYPDCANSPPDLIVSALVDLAHYCDHLNVCYGHLDRLAHRAYQERYAANIAKQVQQGKGIRL